MFLNFENSVVKILAMQQNLINLSLSANTPCMHKGGGGGGGRGGGGGTDPAGGLYPTNRARSLRPVVLPVVALLWPI